MRIQEFINHIRTEMNKVVVGQDRVVEELALVFLCGGHVLLEGVPGLAKTLIARTFARIIGEGFNRIQFTPDLMPSDILGTMVFNLQESRFVYQKGPVFTNILLGDEINRTSPKTQSALLEVMQEKQVTVDGTKYPLTPPFMVMATQNPVEFEGTYPLPEAQLDRFMIKACVDYPQRESELAVLERFNQGFDSNDLDKVPIEMIRKDQINACHDEFKSIRVDRNILEYILNICNQTRTHPAIILGASTRAGITLLNLAKWCAGADGRNYVIPDDVKKMALPVLRHRIILQADAEIEGSRNDDIVKEIIEKEKVPR